MTTPLCSYPVYRDSGVPWLGRIPAHWQVRRNGSLFAQRNETGYGDLPILEVSFNTGVRVRNFDSSSRKQIMSDREKYKRAVRGDIAYNMMRLWQGAVGVVPTDGLVSPAYVVARPYPGTISPYFIELFRTDACKAEVNKYSHGIVSDRNRLYWDEFKQMPVCVPPPDEQAAIIRFLSYIDQSIRRFVQGKRRLIELLKEQMSHEIEETQLWAEDWPLVKLGHHVDLLPGYAFPSAGFTVDEVNVKLRGVNVGPGAIKWNQVVRWPSRDLARYSRYLLEPGDIVIGMDRPWISTGIRVAVVGQSDVPALLLQRVARLRPKPGLLPDYLVMVFTGAGFLSYFEPILTGISVPHISPDQIAGYRFRLPPLETQHSILDRLKHLKLATLSSMRNAQQEVSLIGEYRTRLIADIVTGKLDVRETAERLPLSAEQEVPDEDTLGLSALDPEESDGLADDAPELLSVSADED